jgi:hypothetical protein
VLELAAQRLGKRFEKERCAKLWGSLVAAFGDDALAMRAVQRDPTVLDPRTDPAIFGRAKAALATTLGSEGAAREAMLRNPSVMRRRDVQQLSRAKIEQQALIAAVRRADGLIAAVVLCGAAALYSDSLAVLAGGAQ